MIDTGVAIDDTLVLTTVEGGEPLLQEAVLARPEGSEVRLHPGVVECRWRGPLRGLCDLPLAHRVQLWCRASDLLESLSRSRRDGVLSALGKTQQLAFRVGAATAAERQSEIEALTTRFGWQNSTSSWDLNLELGEVSGPGRGLVSIDVGALHWNVRFASLQRQSFSTPTPVATVLARLSRVGAGEVALDPFCGAATTLVAVAVLSPTSRLLGSDTNPEALGLAAANLRQVRGEEWPRSAALARAEATRLPTVAGTVDAVLANLPFGKRVGSHADNDRLYPAALAEIARVLSRRGRATLLTEDKRRFEASVRRTRGLSVVASRVLRYGGATPTCYSLQRRGR